MVGFGETFELQKIPEWYNMYFHYKQLNKMTENFKLMTKQGQLI